MRRFNTGNITLIWEPLELLLSGIAITISIFAAILYVFRGNQKEKFNEKIVIYGFASICNAFAGYLLFIVLGELFIPGSFNQNGFYGDYGVITNERELLTKIAFCCFSFFFALFFYGMEINFKRSKFLISVVQIALIVIVVLLPFQLANLLFYYILFPFVLAVTVFFLFYLTNHSILEVKGFPSMLALGGAIFASALSFTSPEQRAVGFLPTWTSALLFAIAAIITIFPVIIHPRHLAQSIKYWIIFGFFVFTLELFVLAYYIQLQLLNWILEAAYMPVLFIYFQFKNLKILINEAHEKKALSKPEDNRNLLSVFSRRSLIPEEEFLQRATQTAHELKTPISPIVGFSHLAYESYEEIRKNLRILSTNLKKLKSFRFNGEERETIVDLQGLDEKIQSDFCLMESDFKFFIKAAERLRYLTEKLLFFSRIEGKFCAIKKERKNLREIVQSCVDLFVHEAVSQNITLKYENSIDVYLNVDELAILIVIQNLLSNAIKYNHPNGLVIITTTQNPTHIVVSIKDTGIGIEPEDMGILFTKFGQIPNRGKTEVSRKGLGIGLYTTNEIVKLHGGKLWAQSAGRDKGTVFHIELPLV